MKCGKHQRSKQSCQDLCWKVHTLHNLLFWPHTLCMNYVANTFLSVRSSVQSKQLLCFLQRQGQTSEQKKNTTLYNLLFWAHTLCMNYVANTFLSVRSSVQSKQLLCFLQRQGQKSEQKTTTTTTTNFDEFHNHSPLLTMTIATHHSG